MAVYFEKGVNKLGYQKEYYNYQVHFYPNTVWFNFKLKSHGSLYLVASKLL